MIFNIGFPYHYNTQTLALRNLIGPQNMGFLTLDVTIKYNVISIIDSVYIWTIKGFNLTLACGLA